MDIEFIKKENLYFLKKCNEIGFDNYTKFVVSGPQRSGTRIHAKIISEILNLKYIDERDINFHNYFKLIDIAKYQNNFIVQCPCLTHNVFKLPKDIAIIIIKRDINEIIQSENRIRFPVVSRKKETNRLQYQGYNKNLRLSEKKYMYINEKKDERTFYIDFGYFFEHNLWVEKNKRKNFKMDQTGFQQ